MFSKENKNNSNDYKYAKSRTRNYEENKIGAHKPNKNKLKIRKFSSSFSAKSKNSEQIGITKFRPFSARRHFELSRERERERKAKSLCSSEILRVRSSLGKKVPKKNQAIFKENKENQVTNLFNYSLYDRKNQIFPLTLPPTKNAVRVRNQFLNLKNVNYRYSKDTRIVSNINGMIDAFSKQTKSNYNNKYKVVYFTPDSKQRESIINCFGAIKKNKNDMVRNLFKSYESISVKNLFSTPKEKKKKTVKLLGSPFFENKKIFSMNINIRAMKIIDSILKNDKNNYKPKNDNKCSFFKTLT